MFRLSLSSHINFVSFLILFRFLRHQSWQLVSLRPETRAAATRVSRSKWVQSTKLDIADGPPCNLCALSLGRALHIFAAQCWLVPRRKNGCPLLQSCLVSQNVFHVVSALQFIVCLNKYFKKLKHQKFLHEFRWALAHGVSLYSYLFIYLFIYLTFFIHG